MRMNNVLGACAIVAIAGSAAGAQSISWLLPQDGDWGVTGNWAGGNIPDNAGEIAVLGHSGAYTVTSNSGRTLGGLTITNPAAMLRFDSNTYSLSGDVLNNGLLTLNFNDTVFNSTINFQNSATISGSGTVRMIAGSSTDDAQINASSGTLTHASGHTIAGSGRLSGTMDNSGDIIADDPPGRGLELRGSVTQSGTGRIGADAGVLILGGNSVTTGGEFFTLNNGKINVPSGLATISDVDSTGDITIAGNSATLSLGGSIDNNASITINPEATVFNAHLRFDTSATIGGSGTIAMLGHSDQPDAQIYTNGAFTATIASGQTVHGSGQIDGRAGGEIINNGTIIADDDGFMLGLSGVHNPGSGQYRAQGDGVLGLNNGSVLTGLVFDTSGNGSVDVNGSTATVSSIISNGRMTIPGRGWTLALNGTMTNNGTLTINSTDQVFNARLRFDSSTQVNGSGDIVMIANSNRDDAQIYTAPGITGTLGGGQTIRGAGWIDGRDGGTIIVNATVIGNDPDHLLSLDGSIDATGGGVFRGDGGVVALDGGLVLNGGTFESVGEGAVSKTNHGVATLSGVTNNGTMSVLGMGGIIDLAGDLTNNGLCLLNPDLSVFNAHIRAINDVMIDGSGTVRLYSPTNLDDAQVFTGDVVTLTIGPDQTVAGAGRVNGDSGGTIVNHGTINGDEPGFELRLLGNHSGTGVYRSDNGTLGLGSGVVMSGGVLDSSGTGSVAKADNGVATISNMTNTGQLNILGSGGFIDLASDLTNNGEIWINADSNLFNAHLRFTDSFTIDGTGTIRMSAPTNRDDAQIIVNDTFVGTIGTGQTVIGDGQLVGELNINGTIDPGGPTRVLTTDDVHMGPSAELHIDLGGLSEGTHDRVLVGAGDVLDIDGTLSLAIDDGYIPSFGDTWDIISGSTTGTFSDVDMADAPFGQVYRVIYTGSRVYVILTCDGDLTGDGGIDFFDVSIFLNYFGSQDTRGDLNNDGLFNFFDISLFLQLFGQGCDA